MTRQEIEKKYTNLGLTIEHGIDPPGKIYEQHKHERTHLYTLSGAIDIKLGENDWQTFSEGQECIIEADQLHEAKVGLTGWEYVAAWKE